MFWEILSPLKHDPLPSPYPISPTLGWAGARLPLLPTGGWSHSPPTEVWPLSPPPLGYLPKERPPYNQCLKLVEGRESHTFWSSGWQALIRATDFANREAKNTWGQRQRKGEGERTKKLNKN